MEEKILVAKLSREIPIRAKVYRATAKSQLEDYEGAYEVIPKTTPQTLETKDKILRDNVTVFAIPYAEVSNPSDGKTAIIGEKIDYLGDV